VRRIVISRAAEEDLLAIWMFIAHDSIEQADKLEAAFEKTFDRLAVHPQMGRTRPDIASETVRFFVKRPYHIVYRAEEDRLFILRVLHGARDLPGRVD
jgi:toxin ParE1/3/4